MVIKKLETITDEPLLQKKKRAVRVRKKDHLIPVKPKTVPSNCWCRTFVVILVKNLSNIQSQSDIFL